MRGAMYEKMKKFDAAETEFRKVLDLNPKNASALNYLGYMLADRNVRVNDALNYIKQALELDPDNGAYLDSLGWAYYRDGELPKAEEYLRRAIERSAKDPTVHDHLGDVYFKQGNLKDAIAHWQMSLKEWDNSSPSEHDATKSLRFRRSSIPLRFVWLANRASCRRPQAALRETSARSVRVFCGGAFPMRATLLASIVCVQPARHRRPRNHRLPPRTNNVRRPPRPQLRLPIPLHSSSDEAGTQAERFGEWRRFSKQRKIVSQKKLDDRDDRRDSSHAFGRKAHARRAVSAHRHLQARFSWRRRHRREEFPRYVQIQHCSFSARQDGGIDNMIPMSVEREVDGKIGSMTWWLDNIWMTEAERRDNED